MIVVIALKRERTSLEIEDLQYDANIGSSVAYDLIIIRTVESIYFGFQIRRKQAYLEHDSYWIRIWLGIWQIMNSTDRLLMETRDLAMELKFGIHMELIMYNFYC